jgi:hypothetical protein
MPEIIKRNVGLHFLPEELEMMMGGELDFSKEATFEAVVDFLEKCFEDGDFAEYGYDNWCMIDEIEISESGAFMTF